MRRKCIGVRATKQRQPIELECRDAAADFRRQHEPQRIGAKLDHPRMAARYSCPRLTMSDMSDPTAIQENP